MKDFGLGRGLASLIPDSDNASGLAPQPTEIEIKKIDRDESQPRKVFDQGKIDELAASIREHGILQPLIVIERSGQNYLLVAGERRLQAAILAGLSKVPVIIRSMPEQQKLQIQLVENIQRENLNPLEKAMAFKILIDQFNMTQEQAASKLGVSRESLANSLRLLNLPEPIRRALNEGKITEGHAKVLLGAGSEQNQLALFRKITKESLTVKESSFKVKIKAAKNRRRKSGPTPEIVELVDRLREKLGTKVEIKKGKEQGEIVVYFYSDRELLSLVEKITKKEFTV